MTGTDRPTPTGGSARRPRAWARLVGVICLPLVQVGTASGQWAGDSVRVAIAPAYAAGGAAARIWGAEHRTLWTTPVLLPVVDLDTFAGGLTPVERGGGMQTRSLRLLGRDGREYNFRSADKEITQGLVPDLQETLIDAILQDQVSSLHPAASIVAAGLLDAVGVLHPGPRLVVLPNSERLGDFAAEFGGMVGTLEVHANETEDEQPDFAGALEVDGTDDVIAAVLASADDRIDAHAYLRERLMSLLMGDWDRHAGQFRWARFDTAGARLWVPVPEDRDYAFSSYDGLFFSVAGSFFPQAAPLGDSFPTDLTGLTGNSSALDRRFLAGLDWISWERTVEEIQGRLTDGAVEDAVRRMPPELFAIGGDGLIQTIRARRDRLGPVARRFYLLLASQPQIHGTDSAERATVDRLGDGGVRVRLSPAEGEQDDLLLDRVFTPRETSELRILLAGGDDSAIVTGSDSGEILLRIVGGAGADTLRDRGSTGGVVARTALYDSDTESLLDMGPTTWAVSAPLPDPVWVPGEILPPRDDGSARSWFSPWLGYEGTEGVIVGGGPEWTWYGFRRYPFAGRAHIRAHFGTRSGDVGLEAQVEARGIGGAPDLWLHARLSDLEAFRFHGLGNDSPAQVDDPILRYRQRLLEARASWGGPAGVRLSFGPRAELLERQRETSASPPIDGYGKVGIVGALDLETRPGRAPLERGFRLAAEGSLHPAAWDLVEPMGRVRADAAAYLPLSGRLLLAGRVGAEQVWTRGELRLPDAALLGGSKTLRGYPFRRFAGDASMHGGAELRLGLGRADLMPIEGDLGLLAFADAGRVFSADYLGDTWHTARGFGVWLHTLGRDATVSIARGEDTVAYFKLGLPFRSLRPTPVSTLWRVAVPC